MNGPMEPRIEPPSPEVRDALERPPCPLCGTGEGQALLTAQDDWNPHGPARGLLFEVRRCEACGACFTSPRFRFAARRMPFEGAYPFYQRARDANRTLSKAELRGFRARADAVERVKRGPGVLLDVGMGDGVFLKVMQDRGWTVAGIDAEPDVVAYAQQRFELQNVSAADLEVDPLPPGPFDAVTMWGVLQLIYDPQALLERMRAIVAPGGVVGIGVSNFASVGARLFRNHWKGLGLPRHLVHYEPESLNHLLGRAGFEIINIDYATPYWIAGASTHAVLPLPSVLGKISRRSAASILGLLGRTRYGDTMTALARVAH